MTSVIGGMRQPNTRHKSITIIESYTLYKGEIHASNCKIKINN